MSFQLIQVFAEHNNSREKVVKIVKVVKSCEGYDDVEWCQT